MGYKLEPATLRHLWPRAAQAKIDAICEISAEVFDEFGIGDDHRVIAQLMGNISHENGGGTIVRESGHYRPDRLVEVFGAPHSSAAVTSEEAQYLCHDEKALFERVYNLPHSPKLARELGNHLPGDGHKYRGNGDLQLTGRGSHERIGKMTGHSEIGDNPDLLADPKISFKIAVAEFAALGCIALAKARNTTLVRRKVNGGTNGLNEVAVWVRKWEEALPEIEAKAWVPRGSDTDTKTLKDSTIIKGSIGTAVATGGSVLSQVGTVTQQASDTIGTVQTTVDTATTIVHGVPPAVHAAQTFLGLMPQVWIGIGIACGVLALVGCGYIGWQRYLKYRDQGV